MRSRSPCRQVPPIPGDVTPQLRSLPWDVPWVSWFRQRVHQKPCVHFSFCFWLRVGSSGLTHESLPAGHFRLRSFALRGGRSSLTWVPRRPFGVERPENCPHSGEDGGVERFTGVVSLNQRRRGKGTQEAQAFAHGHAARGVHSEQEHEGFPSAPVRSGHLADRRLPCSRGVSLWLGSCPCGPWCREQLEHKSKLPLLTALSLPPLV